MHDEKIKCPCGSGLFGVQCCFKFIDAEAVPASAEQLMRSRYTAYCLQNEVYILETWHVSTRPELCGLDKALLWKGLNVLDSSKKKGKFATVEFVASYEERALSGKIETGQIHELSRFICDSERWFYLDGEAVVSKPVKVGRNASCVCGSGLKFKKCCGRS